MGELQLGAVRALQILDSRGYPTLQVQLEDTDGGVFEAAAPDGGGGHAAALAVVGILG